MTHPFDWTSLVARVLFGFFIVFAVYNPSGHSYWHWVFQGEGGFWLKFAVGMGLLGVHAIVITSVLGVLKWRGVLLVTATLFGGWMAISNSIGLGSWSASSVIMVLLTGLSLIYATGLSFPHLHHRLSGIAHVEKVY
jgi:hypothetical protein